MASLVNTTLLLCIFAFYHAIWLDGMTYAAKFRNPEKCIVGSADKDCQNLINEKGKKNVDGNQPVKPYSKSKTTDCGDTYSTATGTINHPAISGSYYENNEMCTWIVKSSIPLYFSFSKFSTEIDYDFLTVRDGGSIGSSLLETLSGKSLSSTFVTTGDTHMTFESDSTVISTGFILHWRIYTADEQCKNKNGTCLQTGDRCRGLVEIITNSCEDHCVCCLMDEDINECNDDNGGCSQNCHNTHGSFSCSCQVGYSLDVDGKTCIDINECAIDNGCSQSCQNTDGSFDCSCFTGFSLNDDKMSCTCSGFECISNGMCLDYSSTRCNSVMDCEDGSDEAGCDCSILGDCDVNARCFRPHGSTSHICECNVGYSGNGKVCGLDQDLDGFPDEELDCNEPHCFKDNCPSIPNSGQEDQDDNGMGDACDFVPEPSVIDTLPLPPCDNKITSNCIEDIDKDGIENLVDNCPNVANTDQINSDGDHFGDACDNCPFVINDDQEDADQDLVGDLCDNGSDRDGDGVQDDLDNCPDVPNPNQINSDDDSLGDACDDDADNDGITNDEDNCWLVYNPRQRSDHPCVNDDDNDGVDNFHDNCPNNSDISKTDFRTFHRVNLDPYGTAQVDPVWVIMNDGAEISQTKNSDPGLVFGKDVFYGVNFEGTFYVGDKKDDDYAGIIFSYQSSARFYMMQWKRFDQDYWHYTPFKAVATDAITLKRVNSVTGPGSALRNAIWHNTGDIPDQTKVLWTDPQSVGWEPFVAYRWQLMHRPEIGLIRLRILKGVTLIADSGNIFDNEIKGGHLGAFVFSQEGVIWSNLRYRCNDDVPESIYIDLPANLQNKVNIDYSWDWW